MPIARSNFSNRPKSKRREPRRLPRNGADRLHLPRPVSHAAASTRRRGRAGSRDCRSVNVFRGVAVVRLPLVVDGQLFNAAAVMHAGKLLGIVPKIVSAELQGVLRRPLFRPGRQRSGDDRHCRAGKTSRSAPTSSSTAGACPAFVLGVEICEDLWMPVPPSSAQAVAGATVLANLSASNEVIGKARYRKQLVAGQSGRCIAGLRLFVVRRRRIDDRPRLRRPLPHRRERHGARRERAVPPRRAPARRRHRPRTPAARPHADQQLPRRPPRSAPPVPPRPFDLELTRRASRKLLRAVDAASVRARRTRPRATSAAAKSSRRRSRPGPAARAHRHAAGVDRRLRRARLDARAPGRHARRWTTSACRASASTACTMPGFGTTARTKGNAHALMKQLGVSAREMRHPSDLLRPDEGARPRAVRHQARRRDGRIADARSCATCRRRSATTWSSRTCRPALGPACS